MFLIDIFTANTESLNKPTIKAPQKPQLELAGCNLYPPPSQRAREGYKYNFMGQRKSTATGGRPGGAEVRLQERVYTGSKG